MLKYFLFLLRKWIISNMRLKNKKLRKIRKIEFGGIFQAAKRGSLE